MFWEKVDYIIEGQDRKHRENQQKLKKEIDDLLKKVNQLKEVNMEKQQECQRFKDQNAILER